MPALIEYRFLATEVTESTESEAARTVQSPLTSVFSVISVAHFFPISRFAADLRFEPAPSWSIIFAGLLLTRLRD